MALATAIAVPLTVYCLTVSNTVRLEDDGLFLMAGHDLGIAHPPGYPVFTWLVWLALQVPFGNPALLGHLLAAGLGALTCGALYHCARLVGASPAAALAAALLFGVSEQLWSQAIITDVYTLNTLLFFTLHGLLIRATLSPGNTRILYVAGGL